MYGGGCMFGQRHIQRRHIEQKHGISRTPFHRGIPEQLRVEGNRRFEISRV
jgi:hypothetical protein